MKYLYTILILLVLGTTNNINAQWVQANGPYGGVINCIGGNSWELFAGTNGGGLYRSTDNGNNWTRFIMPNTKLFNYSGNLDVINDIYVRDSIIIMTANTGFWVSNDDGNSWNYLLKLHYWDITNKFYFCGNYLIYAYKDSPNIAEFDSSFSDIIGGIAEGSFNYNIYRNLLEVNATYFNMNFIVAGTNYGVYVSSDTGKTWTRSNTNLTDTSIKAVAKCDSKIFAGTEKSGIFVSPDSGKSWLPCNSGLTTLSVTTLSVSDNIIYAGTNGGGIFRSTDYGASWQAMNTGLKNPFISQIYFKGNEIIAGTNGGGIYIYKGQSWDEKNNGLTASKINTFLRAGDKLFAGSDGGGIYLTTDEGVSWNEVNSGLQCFNINSLAMDGNNLFAGTTDGGIFRSTDYGQNWVAANNGISSINVNAITVSGNNIIAAGNPWGKNTSYIILNQEYLYADSCRLYLSSDHGNNWSLVDTGYVVNYLTSSNSDVFAGLIGGIGHSSDSGKHWNYINQFVATGEWEEYLPVYINQIIIRGSKIFAGQFHFGISSYNIQDIILDTLFQYPVYPTEIGIYPTCSFLSIAQNDTAIFSVYNGLTYYPLYGIDYSTDEGKNWKVIHTPFINGVPGLQLEPQANSISLSDKYLFVGTRNYGIWKLPLADIATGIKDKTVDLPTKYLLNQNYPNPFNPSTTIKYELPQSGFVSLKVYDILGREVQTLVNGNKIKGTYEVSFNGSNLASGVYLYKLKAGNFTSIKKMMLIK
jgi:photosystem II stability/assembly factor-like uncharacterized protein